MLNQTKDNSSNHVKSVLKAFAIIEELDSSGELSLGELSERLSMDKATAHRLVNTIKSAGYVTQNPDNKKYTNSIKLFTVGKKAVDSQGVRNVARPFIEELAQKTGETVNLGALVGKDIVYIDKIESRSTIKVSINVGTSIPSYCTGMGKAVLAYMKDEEVVDLLKDEHYHSYTKNSAKSIEELFDKLREVRNQGLSMDNEEFVNELISFGAPIFDYHNKPIAAISVSFPKYRYEENVHYSLYSKMVMETAVNISRQLGYKNR